jgi:hypothetical protein
VSGRQDGKFLAAQPPQNVVPADQGLEVGHELALHEAFWHCPDFDETAVGEAHLQVRIEPQNADIDRVQTLGKQVLNLARHLMGRDMRHAVIP